MKNKVVCSGVMRLITVITDANVLLKMKLGKKLRQPAAVA